MTTIKYIYSATSRDFLSNIASARSLHYLQTARPTDGALSCANAAARVANRTLLAAAHSRLNAKCRGSRFVSHEIAAASYTRFALAPTHGNFYWGASDEPKGVSGVSTISRGCIVSS